MSKLLIGGKFVSGKGLVFNSLNPVDGKVIWQGNTANDLQVAEAVASGVNAFKSWSKTAISERLSVLEKFKFLLERDKADFALLISQETGKPYWESLTEIVAMIGKLTHSMNAYLERCPSKAEEVLGVRSVLRFKPIGVMAVFGPFNLPVHLPNGHIIPALLAGNTVVFKPSEQTPATGERLVSLLSEAGVPEGVVNLIQGGPSVGSALVANPQINGVLFTGSHRVGTILHKSLAGRPEVMLALEMGGNNPLIWWNSQDLIGAAYSTIQSAFITAGQRCVCARRLIVPYGEKGDEFIDCLDEMTGKLSFGSPSDRPEPFMGTLISAEAATSVLKSQEDLITKGGRVIRKSFGSKDIPALLSPGIIDVTGWDMPDEEIFGPVLQVIRVKDFEEAVYHANKTRFGLSAGIICDDYKVYEKFLENSPAGIINWNRQITGAVSSNPFGGSGASGNYRPSAYFAADYCAYPVASIELEKATLPENLSPGIIL